MKEYRTVLKGRGRSAKQVDEDFEICCQMLAEGATWVEITKYINTHRPYSVSLTTLRSAYSIRVGNAVLEESPQQELSRLIEDLDAIMMKAMEEFHESKGMHTTIRKKGIEIKDENGVKTILNPETVITQMKKAGDVAYLNTFLAAHTQKCKLLGHDKVKINVSIESILQGQKLTDGEFEAMPPIRSENEAKLLI